MATSWWGDADWGEILYGDQFITSSTPSIDVPAGSLSLAAFAPIVTPLELDVPAGALVLTGFAPVLLGGGILEVPTGALTLTGFAPALGRSIPVPAGALSLAGFIPTVTISNPGGKGNHAANFWWSGAAARMINDAGFLLLVEPHLEEGEKYNDGKPYTGEPQPSEGGE